MRIDLTPVWYQEINLIGTLGHGMETWPIGSQEQRPTFAIAAEMIEQGQLDPEQLITHRFALYEYRHALDMLRHKSRNRAIKVIFDYSLQPASVVPNVRTAAQWRPIPDLGYLSPREGPRSIAPSSPIPSSSPMEPEPTRTQSQSTRRSTAKSIQYDYSTWECSDRNERHACCVTTYRKSFQSSRAGTCKGHKDIGNAGKQRCPYCF